MSQRSRSSEMMPLPEVSVVVPVYNGADLVAGLLAALERQTIGADAFEVIVVDDASTDSTVEAIERFRAGSPLRLTLLHRSANRGPAAARNAGIAAARAGFIAFTDADCEPDPNWLERGLIHLTADDTPDGVEGRTLPKGVPGPLTHQMENTTGGLFMTCNMLYRRAALGDGFDERFTMAFLEDSDVAFRVFDQGGLIVWAPDVVVRHLVLPIGRAKFLKEARKRRFSPLLRRKHPKRYDEFIRGVVPGLPPLHLKYLASIIATLGFAVSPLPGVAIGLAFPTALYARRVLHAYRARDPLTVVHALARPFVQTWYVVCGMVRYGHVSWRI